MKFCDGVAKFGQEGNGGDPDILWIKGRCSGCITIRK